MGTLVGLGLRVGLGEHLHVGLAEEGQRTNFTPVEDEGKEKSKTEQLELQRIHIYTYIQEQIHTHNR